MAHIIRVRPPRGQTHTTLPKRSQMNRLRRRQRDVASATSRPRRLATMRACRTHRWRPNVPTTLATNHQIRLAARPIGLPKATDWQTTSEPVAEPAGGVLVKVLTLSLDPAMRGWMNEGRSYIKPVEIGEVMRAGGVGRVIAS